MWTVRLSDREAALYQQSVDARNMSRSDAIREALATWREQNGDHERSLSSWVSTLLSLHGQDALLTAKVNDHFGIDVIVDGVEPGDFFAEAVHDAKGVQLWIGDPETDARAFLGRVPPAPGAAITVPVASLLDMGANDANDV